MFSLNVVRRTSPASRFVRTFSIGLVEPRVAVVGAGPAGFYASQNILKNLPDSRIDIFEALPVPFGLVRFGVAPDHPEVKNCISTFNKVGTNERVNLIGNTSLGKDVTLADLLSNYHAVLCTYGVADDKLLNIPGESRTGVVSARDLVSLYNGSPDSDMSMVKCLDTDTVAIIGVGNVALDVARLILAPLDMLRETDVSDTWMEMRLKSRVKKVVILGRRGPLNVSFTIKELREMTKLNDVQSILSPGDFEGVQEQLGSLERPRKRLTDLMLKTLKTGLTPKCEKSWELKLWRTPVNIIGAEHVSGIQLCDTRDKQVIETVDCGLIVRSVGYSSVKVDPDLPWDLTRHVVTNNDGRVDTCPGLYTAGWLATGPRGVIIDTMNMAFKVAANIVTDLSSQELETKPGMAGIKHKLDRSTSWQDWEKIDAEEVRRGKEKGKYRDKIVSVDEMMKIINDN